MDWYKLRDLLNAIRELEVHGLIDGTKVANLVLERYVKEVKHE